MVSFFLSHSSGNKALARLINHTSLANGLSPWYDEEFLKLGDEPDNTFDKAINQSDSHLLLATKDAFASRFVKFEIQTAVKRWKSDKNFKLLIVRLDDHPLDGIPEQIKFKNWNHDDVPGSVLRIVSNLTGQIPSHLLLHQHFSPQTQTWFLITKVKPNRSTRKTSSFTI